MHHPHRQGASASHTLWRLSRTSQFLRATVNMCAERERGGRDGHRTRHLPGVRGDALMSLLFSLGQHQAFVAIQARLQWEENSASGRCPHDLAGRALGACQDQGASRQVTGVEQRSFPSDRGRRINQGPGSQTRCPLSGKVISICQWIIRVLRVPGAPIGTLEYVMRQLKAKSKEHAVLLDRIPAVAVVQAALAFARLPWCDPCELSVRGWSDHSWRSSLRRETTRKLGSVCDGKLAPQTRPIEQCGTQHFRSRLEICVWEVQCHPAVAASIMTGLTDSPEQGALRICERILGERQLAVLPLESLIEGARHLLEDDEDVPSQPRQG